MNRAYTIDPSGLTKFLTVMLRVSIGIGALYFISDLMQFNLLSSSFSQSEAEANDARQALLLNIYFTVLFVTAITFFKWTYRSNVNCRGFGATDLDISPGWTIGWYFVPIMNLFKPYQAMKEIWQASTNPEAWKAQSGSPLLGWWWASWLVGGLLGNMSFRAMTAADSISALILLCYVQFELVDYPASANL